MPRSFIARVQAELTDFASNGKMRGSRLPSSSFTRGLGIDDRPGIGEQAECAVVAGLVARVFQVAELGDAAFSVQVGPEQSGDFLLPSCGQEREARDRAHGDRRGPGVSALEVREDGLFFLGG
jgi:hypothetical protein